MQWLVTAVFDKTLVGDLAMHLMYIECQYKAKLIFGREEKGKLYPNVWKSYVQKKESW